MISIAGIRKTQQHECVSTVQFVVLDVQPRPLVKLLRCVNTCVQTVHARKPMQQNDDDNGKKVEMKTNISIWLDVICDEMKKSWKN